MGGVFHGCLNKNLRFFRINIVRWWNSELQCFPRGHPRNLCVNTGIRQLATHSLWSGAVNLEYWTLKMCWVTASGVYQWKGKPAEPQHCAICLMVVIRRVLHNFCLFLIQKLHSIIIQFKTSSELVAIGRNHWRKADAVKINLPRLGNRSFDK